MKESYPTTMLGNGQSVRIVYAKLPVHIGGGCCPDGENQFLIVINSAKARITQYHALGHELAHVCRNHLTDTEIPEAMVESEAEAYAWDYYRAYKAGKLELAFC